MNAYEELADALNDYEAIADALVSVDTLKERLAGWGATTRKRRARKPTLASVAKQAAKAGIEVARYEIEPDKITVVTGKQGEPKAEQTNDVDEWMAKHAN
jgi:hypothetical protein